MLSGHAHDVLLLHDEELGVLIASVGQALVSLGSLLSLRHQLRPGLLGDDLWAFAIDLSLGRLPGNLSSKHDQIKSVAILGLRTIFAATYLSPLSRPGLRLLPRVLLREPRGLLPCEA